VAHYGGADVRDQPRDVRRVRGILLQVRHGVAVPVLQPSPRLIHRVRVDARTRVQKPVELVLPAGLVRVVLAVVVLPRRHCSMSASRCFVPAGVRPNPPRSDARIQ